jgi:hypothetical protein
MISWLLTGFSGRDLMAVLVKYLENGIERRKMICSAYLPYDAEDPPPTKELGELIHYCDREHLRLITGCDSNPSGALVRRQGSREGIIGAHRAGSYKA